MKFDWRSSAEPASNGLQVLLSSTIHSQQTLDPTVTHSCSTHYRTVGKHHVRSPSTAQARSKTPAARHISCWAQKAQCRASQSNLMPLQHTSLV
jgi:hypothetical protein